MLVSIGLLIRNAWGADLEIPPRYGFVSPQQQVLPNLDLTPGVADPKYTETNQICKVKWGKDARHVTAAMKRQVFESYGYAKLNKDPRCKLDAHGRRFEIDHRVPRELGGMDALRNLWPQCYSGKWNATVKDKLENHIHKRVCANEITLEEGQAIFLGDWIEGYRQTFGDVP